MDRCTRSVQLRFAKLPGIKKTHTGISRCIVRYHAASVHPRGALSESGNTQIANPPAPIQWKFVGLGGLSSGSWQLSWLVHTCLELRPIARPSLPSPGTYLTRAGAAPLDGRP